MSTEHIEPVFRIEGHALPEGIFVVSYADGYSGDTQEITHDDAVALHQRLSEYLEGRS